LTCWRDMRGAHDSCGKNLIRPISSSETLFLMMEIICS
jgi:hypothetical protein